MAGAKDVKSKSAKPSLQDRVARLRERMGEIDLGSNRGFWSPKEGRNTIRIMPPVGEMEFFFQEVGRHYNLPGDTNEICPAFTTSGAQKCPICELVYQLYKGSDSDKKLAGKLRVRKQFWMNVIVRNPKNREEDEGPFIYTPGSTVFQALQSMVGDPDYGDISDADEGSDLVVTRSGEGMNTKYDVMAKRNASSLSDDKEQLDGWMEAAKSLTVAVLSDDSEEDEEVRGEAQIVVLPYDRLIEKYGLEPGVDPREILDIEEDEEPVKASTKKRTSSEPVRTAKRSAKPVVEEDDEDEDEEEDEVGAELRRRAKRR